MKVTLEIKTVKTFNLDEEMNGFIKGLDGEQALDKICEVLSNGDVESMSDIEKVELLESKSIISRSEHRIIASDYEQRKKDLTE